VDLASGAAARAERSLFERDRPKSDHGRLDSRSAGKSVDMGADDTVKNRSQQVKGKAKEVAGKATKNKKLEWSGKSDMAKGEVKQRGSKLTD
jgi:uncharacterized protein YjbJ (UPF0337 family)